MDVIFKSFSENKIIETFNQKGVVLIKNILEKKDFNYIHNDILKYVTTNLKDFQKETEMMV